MPREGEVQELRAILQRRRRDVLEAALGARRELKALKNQERDPEFEENAQSELADFTLSSLLESQRKEIILIDAALRRMDEGVFGECIDCGEPISLDRLRALPFAIRCEEDATLAEQQVRSGAAAAPPTF